jgi:peptidyl-tRNA hydrolase, PTH1 family
MNILRTIRTFILFSMSQPLTARTLWIVGLGNPTSRYARTRHNVGWMMLDYLAKRYSATVEKQVSQFRASLQSISVDSQLTIQLVRPQTYMNLSGQSVAALARFYRVPITSDILVITDDVSMEFGKVRLRHGGSAGGHNGLKSLIADLGSENFARLKIGIGNHPRMPLESWVLGRFEESEEASLESTVFDQAHDTIYAWIHGKA